ncbi:TonB-dependent receptor [Pusillimonas sp. CC-YST705]|uniref:TonB-dependent receptor n=1 Tax=Mesopusillimonas faecipullorum TaxID=2755040 RepID=A0ABS8CC49_9BURK|nr:TonB-dependent receptor [Mesopusillimonas faecipullorum]MCB5363603.1 TonB-dependent receptor [Mesopusillimonas faecipullorum]
MFISLRSRRPLAAALWLLTPLACAQSPSNAAIALDDVVVTASRMPQLSSQVLGDITVLDSAALRQSGQNSLAEILARQHGIEFSTNGGPQTVTGANIRGAGSGHTLVLVDGVPINTATNSLASLHTLPVAMIERIEILRGSASSLYGSNAIGGVIHIITKPEARTGTQARATVAYGSRATARASASVAGGENGWRYHLAGSAERSRGYDATDTDTLGHNPDRDGFRNTSVSGSLDYEWRPEQSVGLQFLRSRVNGQIDYDYLRTPGADDKGVTTLESVSLASRNKINDVWHSTLRYTYNLDRSETLSLSTNTVISTRQNQLAWENLLTLSENHSLLLAYEHLNQRVYGDLEVFDPVTFQTLPANYDATRRHNNAYTSVYSGRFGHHHAQASLRHDRDSQFGGATTWGLSYGFDITSELRARVAANTGYQAPDFNELYYPGMSNPNLRPEKSRNLEAALEYTGERLSLGATVYQNKIRDMITMTWPDPPLNIDNATIRGLTLTGRYAFNASTAVWASADFNNPRDDATNAQLPRRAKRIFRLGAEHKIGKWQLGTDYMHVSRRYDDMANTKALGAYGLWNLSVGYELTPRLTARLHWNNILDKRYASVYGYRMPRTHVYAELAWQL